MKPLNPNFREETLKVFVRQGIVGHLGIEVDELGEGWIQTSLRPGPHHTQQDGFVHAGVLATMADLSGGFAAHTLVAEKERVLTVEFKINFLRPALGDRILCRSKVLKKGKSITISSSELFAVTGEREAEAMVAKAIVTLAIIVPKQE